jgi:hypothetical protein
MLKLYLGFNAVIYAALAVWCTLAVNTTSQSQGFLSLNNSGRSEYLTIYGGLQLGLGIFFALCAWNPRWSETGLVMALCLYVPIVLWRMASLATHWPVGNVTLYVAGLELFMLLWAGWIWFSQRGA